MILVPNSAAVMIKDRNRMMQGCPLVAAPAAARQMNAEDSWRDFAQALCTGRVLGDELAAPSRRRGNDRPSSLDHVLVSRPLFPSMVSCHVPQDNGMWHGSDDTLLLLQLRLFATADPPVPGVRRQVLLWIA